MKFDFDLFIHRKFKIVNVWSVITWSKKSPANGASNYSSIVSWRWARRIAFIFSILFLMEGLTKNVLFLNSLRTPDLSYFFLNLLRALSIDSFSPTVMPTKLSPRFVWFYDCNFSINFFVPNFWNSTEIERCPLDKTSFETTLPKSSQSWW